MVDPLNEYYEGVAELIKDRCGDGVVLILSPPLTKADKLVRELGEDRVRHHIIGSRSGRKEVEALRGILEEIRKGGGLVSDGKLMSKLRGLLGNDLVGGVKPGCIIPYYISWEEAREYANKMDVDEGVKNALMLIINGFEGRSRRITWFGLDYMPEELVEEVKSAKSEDVEGWVSAYLSIVSKLGLDEEFSDRVRRALKEFAKGHFGDAIKALLSSLKVPEPYTQAAVSILSFIAVLLSDKRYVFGEVIDVLTRLRSLSRDGELSVLGRLIVYKLAVSMGLNHEDVYNALTSIGGLGVDELRSIVSRITESVKEIEERLRVIDEIKRWTKENKFEIYDDVDFEDGKAYPGILVRGNELVIEGSTVGESILERHRVVTSGNFNALKDEVLGRLNDKGVVVLVGPRGIGKTTLAAYVTWTLFKEGELGFMVNVKDIEEVGTEFTGFIRQYLDKRWSKYGDLLVVYDPSTTKTYSLADKKTEVPEGISNTIDTLLRYITEDEKVRGKVRLLVVLPTDIYQALSQDLKDRLSKYVLNLEEKGFLKNPEFIAEVIREYARGCRIDYGEAKALAGEILGRFSEGYTLIARLAGTLIASRYGCRVDDVRRVIEESRGNAHYLILRYINSLFKIHEDPDTAKALVEIFTLRRPFVNITRPGIPILTPGIIKLIGEKKGASLLYSAEGKELRGWLALRQHDLIEESIEELLRCIANEGEECKELGDALEPWRLGTVREPLKKISEEVVDVGSAVKYFANNYGEKLTDALRTFGDCWRRAALIIGHALAGYPTVLRLEDLPKDITESLKDALNRCGIDDYLISNNSISLIVQRLIASDRYRRYLTNLLVNIDKYINAINEIREIHKVARARGQIYNIEALYGLGLIAVIADTANLGESINHDDADVALDLASTVIQRTASLQSINSILSLLKPLSTKAPHRYLQLLTPAAIIEELDKDTVKHVFNEVREVLIKHYDEVKHYTWPLVNIIYIYTELLNMHRRYFEDWEIEEMIMWVDKALHDLSNHNKELSIIAWAYVLSLLLTYNDDEIRKYMEKLRINDAINKSSEIIERLDTLVKRAGELVSDKVFRNYVESIYFKAGEEEIKRTILNAKLNLKGALARFKLSNDELDEAIRIFEELVAEYGKFGSSFEGYLVVRSWLLRSKAIKGSISNDELVKGFEELLNEALINAYLEGGGLTVLRQDVISYILSNYLISLALENNVEKIKEVLMEYELLLNTYKSISILTKLTLNALLEQEDKLTNKFTVKSEELIETFAYDMYNEFLPALRFTYGLKPSEGDYEECKKLSNESAKTCNNAISAVMGNSDAVKQMRSEIIYKFQRLIKEKMEYLLKFGFNADDLIDNFEDLVNNFDGRFLVRLLAPRTSTGQLALMLHALTNGDRKDHNLVKAYALYGIATNHSRLLVRLFLDVYESCPDLSSEKLRRSLANLFLLHV